MMKKIVTLILAVMCAMNFATVSFAVDTQHSGQCGDNVFWSFDEATGTLTISGSGEVRDYEYNLTYGEPMPWHGKDWTISSLIIKEGVTGIGKAAFYYLSDLKEVSIPESVKKIGYFAFRECSSVEKIYYAGSLGDWCEIQFNEYGSNPMNPVDLRFDNYCELYVNNSDLITGDVEIPAGTKCVNGYAFVDYKNLTSISIPSSVKTIGKEAFLACENIKSVDFAEGLENISEGAFRDCHKLERVSLPDSVTTIGMAAFANCRSLNFLETGKGLKELSGYGFANAYVLEKVTLNGEFPELTEYTFSGCFKLKEVSLPNSIKKIGKYAFSMCRELTDIYFYGTEAEWNAIEISDTDNEYLDGVKIHYMGEGAEFPEVEPDAPVEPDEPDVPDTQDEPGFWDKVVSFFEGIRDFFAGISDWFANLIKF